MANIVKPVIMETHPIEARSRCFPLLAGRGFLQTLKSNAKKVFLQGGGILVQVCIYSSMLR